MNKIFALFIPCIFLLSFLYATKQKVKVFDSFTSGVKNAIPLVLSVFPYVAAVTMLIKLYEASGLNVTLIRLLSPVFSFFRIPEELAALLLLKPLSGGGSIAVLSELLADYGIDAYVSRCACVAYGAADTTFYISAVYFAGIKRKKLPLAIVFSLVAYFISVIVGCALCLIM